MTFQPQLTNEDIKRIADLIKIFIPEDQFGQFRDQLDTSLDAASVFDELDLDGVEETSTSIGTINVFRNDEANGSLSTEEALMNVDSQQDGFIVVQRVVQK